MNEQQDTVEKEAAAAKMPSAVSETVVITEDHREKRPGACSVTTYQCRTLRSGSVYSKRRLELLPAYPTSNSQIKTTAPATSLRTLLLLPNVAHIDREQCEKESFCGGHGFCPFELNRHRYVEAIDSFMLDFYRDLYIEPSRRWKVHASLVDYNLSRLHKCMEIYTKQTYKPAMLSFSELPLALEFFMQIDVDVFFLKTCGFRDAHPRMFQSTTENEGGESEPEGILCQAEPTARYGTRPCRERNCFLCEPQRGQGYASLKATMQFSAKQRHCFVSKYEAYLNCNANCNTSNVIYALTCPCGQCDFIGSTSTSFYDRMSKHRDESNRIIREFLIGPNNMEHLDTSVSGSAQRFASNQMLLYQHSARCPPVVQLFLDRNPQYWCLVPMRYEAARADDEANASAAAPLAYSKVSAAPSHSRARAESATFVKKPAFFEAVLRDSTRSDEESLWLTNSVPKPPSDYRFSRRQIEEQVNFFKFKKEASVYPSDFVDCYHYTIVAVLPDDCSSELREFIEALFITHAEPKLNTIGRLTHKGPWPSFDTLYRGMWCDKLVRQ